MARAGIYLDNGSQNYIVDHNVVWNCDFGLKMNPPCYSDLIVNNTFVGTQFGLESSGNEAMQGCQLVNNIFTRAAMIGPGAVQSHNLFSTTNPQFVNPWANNYQLEPYSPARDAGAAVGGYTQKYVGRYPDIGAYEYGLAPFAAGQAPHPVIVWGPTTQPPPPPPVNPSGNYPAIKWQGGWGIANVQNAVRFEAQWAWAEYKNIDFGAGAAPICRLLDVANRDRANSNPRRWHQRAMRRNADASGPARHDCRDANNHRGPGGPQGRA